VPRRASMHDTAHAPRSGPTTLPNGNVCVMSRFRWSAQLPPILQARWIPYLTALAGCVALLAYWTRLGVTFYGTVEPFQDSSAYQQLYFNIIDAYRSLGYVAVLRMMRDPASTFAYSVLSHHPFTGIAASSTGIVHRDVQSGSRGAHGDVPRCRIIGQIGM
jgi:hypothetical protein